MVAKMLPVKPGLALRTGNYSMGSQRHRRIPAAMGVKLMCGNICVVYACFMVECQKDLAIAAVLLVAGDPVRR